jgi:hypothetical protein
MVIATQKMVRKGATGSWPSSIFPSISSILSSFHKGPQDIFCRKNKCHKADKGKYTIEFRPFFLGKIGVLVNKKFKGKKKNEGYEKRPCQYLHARGFIKKIFFVFAVLWFHSNPSKA